jgi:hypothetical protein
MRHFLLCGTSFLFILCSLGPAVAQTNTNKSEMTKPPLTVSVKSQLYRYVDNAGTKILGYTDDLVYDGKTFKTLTAETEVVKFKTCIQTIINVPGKELKPIQGDCTGEGPGWWRTAGPALEGQFISIEGTVATFKLKDKDGKETTFSLPSDVLFGQKPKSNSVVLFTKIPTAWDADFTKTAKGFEGMEGRNIGKFIKDGGFSVYSAAK